MNENINYMMIVLQIGASFIISCILMSFIEHFVHSRLMHRRSLARFKKTFEAHSAIHHKDHYGHVFSDQPVPVGEDKEIRLTVRKAPVKALPFAALIALVYWPAAIIFILTVTFHHWAWNKIHLEMHKPEGRGFSRWPIVKFLTRYHWLHHRYPNKNFNVVFPFADYVLGTRAHATASDREQLRLLDSLAIPRVPVPVPSTGAPELEPLASKIK